MSRKARLQNNHGCCFGLPCLTRITDLITARAARKPLSSGLRSYRTTIFRVGMQSVNSSTERFCSLLRGMNPVCLLQLYLPNLTGSEGIDSPKQFWDCRSFRLFSFSTCFSRKSDLSRAALLDQVNISDTFLKGECTVASNT